MTMRGMKRILSILNSLSPEELRLLSRSLGYMADNRVDNEAVSRHNEDAEDTGWRTLENDTHIKFGEGGTIEAGPKALVGAKFEKQESGRVVAKKPDGTEVGWEHLKKSKGSEPEDEEGKGAEVGEQPEVGNDKQTEFEKTHIPIWNDYIVGGMLEDMPTGALVKTPDGEVYKKTEDGMWLSEENGNVVSQEELAPELTKDEGHILRFNEHPGETNPEAEGGAADFEKVTPPSTDIFDVNDFLNTYEVGTQLMLSNGQIWTMVEKKGKEAYWSLEGGDEDKTALSFEIADLAMDMDNDGAMMIKGTRDEAMVEAEKEAHPYGNTEEEAKEWLSANSKVGDRVSGVFGGDTYLEKVGDNQWNFYRDGEKQAVAGEETLDDGIVAQVLVSNRRAIYTNKKVEEEKDVYESIAPLWSNGAIEANLASYPTGTKVKEGDGTVYIKAGSNQWFVPGSNEIITNTDMGRHLYGEVYERALPKKVDLAEVDLESYKPEKETMPEDKKETALRLLEDDIKTGTRVTCDGVTYFMNEHGLWFQENKAQDWNNPGWNPQQFGSIIAGKEVEIDKGPAIKEQKLRREKIENAAKNIDESKKIVGRNTNKNYQTLYYAPRGTTITFERGGERFVYEKSGGTRGEWTEVNTGKKVGASGLTHILNGEDISNFRRKKIGESVNAYYVKPNVPAESTSVSGALKGSGEEIASSLVGAAVGSRVVTEDIYSTGGGRHKEEWEKTETGFWKRTDNTQWATGELSSEELAQKCDRAASKFNGESELTIKEDVNAKRAQQIENNRKVFKEKFPDSETISREVDDFADGYGLEQHLTMDDVDSIDNALTSGNEIGKALFARYVLSDRNGGTVETWEAGAYHPGYYDSEKKMIGLHAPYFRKQSEERPIGETYIHEHGHLIDNAMGEELTGDPEACISNDEEFLKALDDDYKDLCKRVKERTGYTDAKSIRRAIALEISRPPGREKGDMAGVHDIISGASKDKVRDENPLCYLYGHAQKRDKYWDDPKNRSTEAFAEMFECQFRPEKEKNMMQYFPKAYARFLKLLEENM